jgi:hypothetical protein
MPPHACTQRRRRYFIIFILKSFLRGHVVVFLGDRLCCCCGCIQRLPRFLRPWFLFVRLWFLIANFGEALVWRYGVVRWSGWIVVRTFLVLNAGLPGLDLRFCNVGVSG